MFPHLSIAELIVLLIVVLLIFGPQRLPDLAASFGKSIRSFKRELKEADETETKSSSSKAP